MGKVYLRLQTIYTKEFFILFPNLRRKIFVNSYWHGEGVPEVTDNIHNRKLFLFPNLRRKIFVSSYWHGEDVPEVTDNIHNRKLFCFRT